MKRIVPLGDGIGVYAEGGAMTGVIRSGRAAVLINAVSPGLATGLREAGVERVDMVLFTHHRRELADGLAGLPGSESVPIVVPAAESVLFTDPRTYWDDPRARWRLLCGHVPYHATHTEPIPVARTVVGGDTVVWNGWRLRVLHTPGPSDGAVTYLVEPAGGGPSLAFTGDLIWGPGTVHDLYSLQHAVCRNGQTLGDYHGFGGAMWTVLDSLDQVLAASPSLLVPAHGIVITRPAEAVALLRSRFLALYRSFVGTSALRWYFPRHVEDVAGEPEALPQQETRPLPGNVRRLCGTTWALLADDGHAMLIDPHSPPALEAAAGALRDGSIRAYDAIWLTHYHHDHVEAAAAARCRFGVPVLADASVAEVVAMPERFFLTCLSPLGCVVDTPTADGQTWRWRNYRLTAHHFPGQTLYHGGLFAVPDDGPTLFFAGDSFTPTGIDDYCAWNRNWLGRGMGYAACLELLQALSPDIILNQHVGVGFHFTAAACAAVAVALQQRESLLHDLFPWEHPDFGTDEAWAHTDPYEQPVPPGAAATVAVRIMNHAERCQTARVSPVLPAGWTADAPVLTAECPARRESRLVFRLQAPADAAWQRVVIPFRVEFGGIAFGAWREAVLRAAP